MGPEPQLSCGLEGNPLDLLQSQVPFAAVDELQISAIRNRIATHRKIGSPVDSRCAEFANNRSDEIMQLGVGILAKLRHAGELCEHTC